MCTKRTVNDVRAYMHIQSCTMYGMYMYTCSLPIYVHLHFLCLFNIFVNFLCVSDDFIILKTFFFKKEVVETQLSGMPG